MEFTRSGLESMLTTKDENSFVEQVTLEQPGREVVDVCNTVGEDVSIEDPDIWKKFSLLRSLQFRLSQRKF